MDFIEIGKNLLGAGLPILGGVLGGPAGGKVGSMIAGVLGCDPEPVAIAEAIKHDPEAMLKLRKMELEQEVELRRLDLEGKQLVLDEQALYLTDKKDARGMSQEYVKNTGHADYGMYSLAVVITIGFFAAFGVLMLWDIPEGSGQGIFLLIGCLIAKFSTVVDFFFGSSKPAGGSPESGMLARLLKKK